MKTSSTFNDCPKIGPRYLAVSLSLVLMFMLDCRVEIYAEFV